MKLIEQRVQWQHMTKNTDFIKLVLLQFYKTIKEEQWQTAITTNPGEESFFRVATFKYSKCSVFNKKLWGMQRNKTIWSIHREKKPTNRNCHSRVPNVGLIKQRH